MKNVIIIFTIIFIWYSAGIFGCILLTMDEIKDTEYNDNIKIITPEVFFVLMSRYISSYIIYYH